MKPLASLATLLRPRPYRLRCSFRRRKADAVGRLVAGASAHICDACVTEYVAVLQQHGGFVPAATTETAQPR